MKSIDSTGVYSRSEEPNPTDYQLDSTSRANDPANDKTAQADEPMPSADEVAQHDAAPGERRKVDKPIVIAIANQKGGVAKTTTVVSLGGALVRHGQEV